MRMRALNERTALVTGGANGIGAATARRLAEGGCTVGILDLDAAAGEDVAGEIAARGRRASFHAADITDYDAVSRAVERFEAVSGPVSFLVNNAGWDRAQNFLDTTPEFWRQVVATAILRSFLEGAEGARIAEGLKRAIPMRRFGVPEDYPGLVAFLLSDDAAYITGQTISVWGGLTMHGVTQGCAQS